MLNHSSNTSTSDQAPKRLTKAQSNELAWRLISDFWIRPPPAKLQDNLGAAQAQPEKSLD